MKGATCAQGTDCAAGSAPTVSAATSPARAVLVVQAPDREGTCWPVDQGSAGSARHLPQRRRGACGQTGRATASAAVPGSRATPVHCRELRREQAQHARNVQRPRRLRRARADTCYPFACAGGACNDDAARPTTIATTASRASTGPAVPSATASCAARGTSACRASASTACAARAPAPARAGAARWRRRRATACRSPPATRPARVCAVTAGVDLRHQRQV